MPIEHLLASEEPNPIIPASYDVLWGSVSFAILLVLFWKFVLPRFTEIVAQRAEQIEGGIAKAKAMQAEAALTRDSYTAQLAAAHQEAAAIRTAAHGEGEQIVKAARGDATAEAEAIVARAQVQIEVERAAAVGSLQRDVGDLALQLASKIVGETLADDARARATVDRFIDDLETAGSSSGATLR